MRKRLTCRSILVLATATAALVASPFAGGAVFTNSTPIAVTTDQGPANLYPSTITPTGLAGSVSKVVVRVMGYQWEHIADSDLLVVAPNNVGVVLMSDACTFFSGPNSPATFTFDDANPGVHPPSGCASILLNVKPFNNQDALLCDADPDVFPSPAPPGPSSGGYPVGPQLLSAFNNMSAATAMGQWKLFVFDDCDSLTDFDGGGMAGGWSLDITMGPTAVALKSFVARPAGRGVLLRWSTGATPGVLGFNVFRNDSAGRVKVNRGLVTSKGELGASYRLVDRPTRAGPYTYRLQTVYSDGTTRWLGTARA